MPVLNAGSIGQNGDRFKYGRQFIECRSSGWLESNAGPLTCKSLLQSSGQL